MTAAIIAATKPIIATVIAIYYFHFFSFYHERFSILRCKIMVIITLSSVSKSLLIVLGTFPINVTARQELPWKVPQCGNEASHIAWTSQRARLARLPTALLRRCTLARNLDRWQLRPNGAGRAAMLAPPASRFDGRYPVRYLSCCVFRFTCKFTAQAVCPCQGSWLYYLPLGLSLNAHLDLPASW